MGRQSFTIIIQTTSSCNLNCSYCYCQENRDNSNNVTFETFRTCLSKIDDFLDTHYEICILFHGGEPLLLGVQFYEHVFKFLKEDLRHSYHTGIQTNLTLLNEQFIQLFQENNCRIGTSLDGHESYHNFHRKFGNGKGSYENVIEKIKVLQEKGIRYGIVSVINDYSVQSPTEFYSFLKEHPNTPFRLNPMFVVKNGRIYAVNPETFGEFLIRVYDLWIADEQPPKIETFEEIIKKLLDKNGSTVCTFLPDCTQAFVTLDWNGDVYPCCHFVGKSEFCYGNLLESTFSQIASTNIRSRISQRAVEAEKLCRGCDFHEICFAGCMANTLIDINLKDYFCNSYKIIFKYINNSLEELLIKRVTTTPNAAQTDKSQMLMHFVCADTVEP